MPAQSERQRRFMAAVHSYQEGRGSGSPQIRKAARSMSKSQSHDFMYKPKRSGGRSKRRSRRS